MLALGKNQTNGGNPEVSRSILDIRDLMSGIGGLAPWKAHEVRWPGMAAAVELSQQLRTESCVVPGNGHCEA